MAEKVEFKTISKYDISDFSKGLTDNEKAKINSVFGLADKYDAKTRDGFEILETKEELSKFYNGIGKELSDKYKSFLKHKADIENIQNAIGNCAEYNEKKYSDAIKSITPQNILEIFENGCDIGIHTGCYKDADTIVPWRSEDKVKEDLNYVRGVLQNLCRQRGLDCSELDKLEFQYSKGDIANYDSDNLLDKYLGLIHDDIYTKEKINPLFNADNSHKLENAIETRYNTALKNNENLVSDDKTFDFGNGKFDKISKQLSGNCWVCAGLNSFISTEEGKAFLEKNIKRDNSRHITAIYLQGAENAGLPKPKGDGVYTFSDKEIAEGQKQLATGDGDFTAYNLAIEQYRKTAGRKHYYDENLGDNSIEGGEVDETYEILTGLTSNENSGETGITSLSLDFDKIYNVVKNKNGTACLADFDHAYSVTGTTDSGELLIQESNQKPDLENNKYFELVEGSNPPTYICTKENFYKCFRGNAIFQWKR